MRESDRVVMAWSQQDKFWGMVDRSGGPDDCWLWEGILTRGGYGTFRFWDRKRRRMTAIRAHRFAYALDGYTLTSDPLHHFCGIRRCVNPRHLGLMKPGEHSHHHRGREE